MHHLPRQAVSILFAAVLTQICCGQDDPFDLPTVDAPLFGDAGGAGLGDADLAGDAGAATDADKTAGKPEEPEEPSPLVIQLDERARRGNLPLSEAVHSLARLGRWADVDRLMTVVNAREIPVAEMAEMARRIGPAMFLRIENNEEISDAAIAAAAKLQEALKLESQAPARLIQAIDDLDSESIDKRLAAARRLLAGGNASIEELVAAVVSAAPKAPRDDILQTMLRLGDGGTAALRQLALYGSPEVRLRAVEALVRIDRRGATAELLTALHASDSTPEEIHSASSVFQRLQLAAPSRATSIAWLHRRLQALRLSARQTANDFNTEVIWTIDESRARAKSQSTRLIMSAYRDVADMGGRLRRIGELPREVEIECVLADMSYRLMVDPDWGDADQITQVRTALGPAVTAPSLSGAIELALEQHDTPALVGLIRLIDPDASPLDKIALLRGGAPEPTPLVQAASFHDPRVRYEAAIVISRMASNIPFAGSSRVKYCLSEMKSLRELPKAILVETRTDVIIQQEKLLDEMGFDSEVVGSVAGLQRAVARGGDLRLIVSKTELADSKALEMVDIIRRMDRGRNVPIVFYGADVLGLDSDRWETPSILIARPLTTSAFAQTMQAAQRRRRLPPLEPIDRRMYRDSAIELLAGLAAER